MKQVFLPMTSFDYYGKVIKNCNKWGIFFLILWKLRKSSLLFIKNSNKVTKKYILGISCFYHDSAASLICDGEIICSDTPANVRNNKEVKEAYLGNYGN